MVVVNDTETSTTVTLLDPATRRRLWRRAFRFRDCIAPSESWVSWDAATHRLLVVATRETECTQRHAALDDLPRTSRP